MTSTGDDTVRRPPGAWQHADFRRLWTAASVSLFGTQVTELALPLTAVLSLHATPIQMGLLGSAGQLPFLLFSLLTGVWVDHIRKRGLLIWTDLLRALLLVSVPLTAWLHLLTFGQLYAVVFLVGSLTVCFEVAQLAYVTTVVPQEQLLDGNSKLQISYSAAEAAGPGLGGLIVQVLTAPAALLVDAVSYLVSAFALWRVQTTEPPVLRRSSVSVVREAAEGVRALLGNPLLRSVIVSSMLMVLCSGAALAQSLLYLVRGLHFNAALIGLIAAAGGLGAIPGALLTQRVAARLGVGRAIVLGWLVRALTGLALPLVAGPTAVVVSLLCAAQVLAGLADTVSNVLQWSLRQLVTPDRLQGRVTASHRFLVYGAGAVGAVLGGVLAARVGLRACLLVCAVGSLLGVVPAALSPLLHLREMPSGGRSEREPAA